MAAAAYFLLFLFGLAVINNQKQSKTTEPIVESVEQTTIPLKILKDICNEFENVQPSLGKYQLIVDAPNGKYTPNTRYKGE